MSSAGIHFNGVNNYGIVPVNLSTATSWKTTINFLTNSFANGGEITSSSTSKMRQQPCIWGVYLTNYKSFFVGLYNGKLFVYSWLASTNNNDVSQLISGSTLRRNLTGEYGWDTGIVVADGNIHTVVIEASYTTNQITVTLDGTNLGYLNVVNKITSSNNNTYLGHNRYNIANYACFGLSDFELEVEGTTLAHYQPTLSDATNKVLTDSSGNGNNATLYGSAYNIANTLAVIPNIFTTSISKNLSGIPRLFVTTIPFSVNITNTFDTSRSVFVEETISADTSREISDGAQQVLLFADTKRSVSNNHSVYFDTSRTVKSYTIISASTARLVLNKNKVQSSIGHNVLTLKPKIKVDSIQTFDTVSNFDFNGGIETSGEYQIPSGHRIYNETGDFVYVDIDVDTKAYNINQWLDLVANFDSIGNFDGNNIGSFITVIPYLRTSNDGTTYEGWQKVISGAQYKAKYFDFKIGLSTTDSNTTVVVKKFGYVVHS